MEEYELLLEDEKCRSILENDFNKINDYYGELNEILPYDPNLSFPIEYEYVDEEIEYYDYEEDG
tara:strand:- start:2756 stop:2947 length:192 start_codon:yes stop_codon:yes gene_type:complete